MGTNLANLRISENQVTDLSILTNSTSLKNLLLTKNPLSNTSYSIHIPVLIEKGIKVEYDEPPADIIKMSDSIFEDAIRQTIDVPTDILTPANTSAVVDLDLTDAGVSNLDIEALKAFTNLKSINLTNNPLSTNAVLVQIPELESAGITVDLGTSAAAKVELSSEQASIPASLSATTDITVTVTDANGNRVKRETINLSVDQGTIQSPAVNNGDGTYTAKYTAGKTAGIAKISVVTSNGKFASTTIELLELVLSA